MQSLVVTTMHMHDDFAPSSKTHTLTLTCIYTAHLRTKHENGIEVELVLDDMCDGVGFVTYSTLGSLG